MDQEFVFPTESRKTPVLNQEIQGHELTSSRRVDLQNMLLLLPFLFSETFRGENGGNMPNMTESGGRWTNDAHYRFLRQPKLMSWDQFK